MKQLAFIFIFTISQAIGSGQVLNEQEMAELAPENWHNLTVEADNLLGVETEKVYEHFQVPTNEIIVAVLDSGVDINHEDLQGQIWINEDEIPGNGIDDDDNGYIDDYSGWNFLGAADGMGTHQINTELANGFNFLPGDSTLQLHAADKTDTRLLRFLLEKQASTELTDQELQDLRILQEQIPALREKALKNLNKYRKFHGEYLRKIGYLEGLGIKPVTLEHILSYKPDPENEELINLIKDMVENLQNGITLEKLESEIAKLDLEANYFYNYVEDPRIAIVGDNPANLEERNYGNNDVIGPSPEHGTQVAGIIAANRENDIGIKGIAPNVKIMPVRVLAKGDERDKDVANGIYYAVNNGARIINLSFGKYSSLNKKAVDDALLYAREKGVLVVHSAGNDNSNIDKIRHFPSGITEEGEVLNNYINVGSSAFNFGKQMVADFTNFGRDNVDILAPGIMIYTTAPNNRYGRTSGTSFSAPIVSGIAALLLSFNPAIQPAMLKDLILQTGTRFPGQVIHKNGEVYLSEICRSGSVANAFNAVSALQNFLSKPSLAIN